MFKYPGGDPIPMTLMKEKDKEYLESKYDSSMSIINFLGKRVNYKFWPKDNDDSIMVDILKGYGSYGIEEDLWEAAIVTEEGVRAVVGWLTDKKMIKYVDSVLDNTVTPKEITDMFFKLDSDMDFKEFKKHIKDLKKLKKEKEELKCGMI